MFTIHTAHDNFKKLEQNAYPGRGVLAGIDEIGNLIQMSWIMGRSQNSRNRVYKSNERGCVYTELAVPDEKADTSLIIYNAMIEGGGFYVASNGHQTDSLLVGSNNGVPTTRILEAWNYEPDAPNFTPRISVISSIHFGISSLFSIISKIGNDSGTERLTYQFSEAGEKNPKGVGYYLSTYESDGNPLPSFKGAPRAVPLRGNAEDIAYAYWHMLNKENRIALALKRVDPRSGQSSVIRINKN